MGFAALYPSYVKKEAVMNTRSPFQAIRSIDYTVIFVRDMTAMAASMRMSSAFPSSNGKEEVIAAFHHPHQHLHYQAVVRIDQHVVSLEAIEVKNELNDFKFSSPQQGVTKIEPESGDFWWDDFSRSQC